MMIRRREPDFSINDIDYNDKAVYDLFAAGNTDGVFQFESGGMKNVLAQLKPNRFEAEELSGIRIDSPEKARESAEWFVSQGVREVIISMADQGIVLAAEGRTTYFRHRIIRLENATGGGDCLLGAYIAGRLEGLLPKQSMRLGISCAVTAIEEDAVSRRSLDLNAVRNSIGSMCIEEQEL